MRSPIAVEGSLSGQICRRMLEGRPNRGRLIVEDRYDVLGSK